MESRWLRSSSKCRLRRPSSQAVIYFVAATALVCALPARTRGGEPSQRFVTDSGSDLTTVLASIRDDDVRHAALLYTNYRREHGESHEALRALCLKVLEPRLRVIALGPDAECRDGRWAPNETGVMHIGNVYRSAWFLEDVGLPEAQPVLESLCRHSDWSVQSIGLGALMRLEPDRGRTVVNEVLGAMSDVDFTPFLDAGRVPPDEFLGGPGGYVIRWQQGNTVALPELTARAAELMPAGGFRSLEAWEYLRATSPSLASEALWKLLEKSVPTDHCEQFFQFVMLMEAVNDNLLKERALRSLAGDQSDRDRAFWGARGLALRGNEGMPLLRKQFDSETHQWRFLAAAALASCGDSRAQAFIEKAFAGKSSPDRMFLAFALAANYVSAPSEKERERFDEMLDSLARDSDIHVAGWTTRVPSALLPLPVSARILANAALSENARKVDWPSGMGPKELASFFLGKTDPVRSAQEELAGLTPFGCDKLLLEVGPAGLPCIRKVLVSGNEDIVKRMLHTTLVMEPLSGDMNPVPFREFEIAAPDHEAWVNAVLASLGDAQAQSQMIQLLEAGGTVPPKCLIMTPNAKTLPYLVGLFLRAASQSPPPEYLEGAARSVLIGLRKALATNAASSSSITK